MTTLTATDFDLDGDIEVTDRPAIDGVAAAMATCRVAEHRGTVTEANADELAAEALAALGIDLPELAEDIAEESRRFLARFAAERAALRVEVVEKATCPKFHCDNVWVRLLKTYHGPATEYVRLSEPGDVHTAPTFARVYLKGHRHPTHADSIHHRSPPVEPGGKRLCAIWTI